jgi:hypothetical protein
LDVDVIIHERGLNNLCCNKTDNVETRAIRINRSMRAMGEAEDTKQRALINALTAPSLEFDVFELARQRLFDVFTAGGRERLESEKIVLYIVEGLQHVSKLLNVLTRIKEPASTEILDALGPVLDEAIALEKAKRLLLRIEGESDG